MMRPSCPVPGLGNVTWRRGSGELHAPSFSPDLFVPESRRSPGRDPLLVSKPLMFPLLQVVTGCCRDVDIEWFCTYFCCFAFSVLVAQSCPTLCNPVDCSWPGSPSVEFSRQEYWSGLLFPFPGDLPNLRTESGSPALQVDSLPSEPLEKPV